MKRPLIAICLVVAIAAIVWTAERLLERTLNRQLPSLLAKELGLPVALAPIRADILSLTARSDRLQMGKSDDPALEAKKVSVSLDWGDLLQGEIRLVTAAVRDLRVKISAWPDDDETDPADYRMLEPWLPASLRLEKARFLSEDDAAWTVHALHWQRSDDGAARVHWREKRRAGAFGAAIVLDSLDDLLNLKRLQADVALEPDDESLPPTRLAIRIEPGDGQLAYRLHAVGSLAGMAGTLAAEGATAWSWPDTSETHFDSLDAGPLTDLLGLLSGGDREGDLEEWLRSALPELSLPVHRGSISLGELRVGNETTRDNVIRFNSSGHFLALTDVIMLGPSGRLRGSAALAALQDAWEIAVAANIATRQKDGSVLARYIDNRWYMREGRTRLHSKGATWGALVDNMTGDFNLSGTHKSEVETPVSISATLDGTPRRFAMQDIRLSLGDSTINGALEFAGGAERKLDVRLESERLDLNFLFSDAYLTEEPGVALPESLPLFPEIDLTWQITVADLQVPGIALGNVKLNIDRGQERGRLALSASGDDNLDIVLNYQTSASAPTQVGMTVDLDSVDIARVFGLDPARLQSRTSGRLVLQSQGRGTEEIFAAMQGDADLAVALRKDGDWRRDSLPEERLTLRGVSSLVLENRRIVGIKIDQLEIDAQEQDLDGSLSLVAGRSPYLIAELRSQHLNMVELQAWLARMEGSPEPPDGKKETDILSTLREFTDVRLVLKVDQLEWFTHPVTEATFELESGLDQFDLKRVDFVYQGARVESRAGLTWREGMAELNSTGNVSALDVKELMGDQVQALEVPEDRPLSGSFTLRGQGRDLWDLLGTLQGQIKLSSVASAADAIDIELERIDNGMRADIRRFDWAGSHLRGSVQYRRSVPPDVSVTVDGGTIDLRPWEAHLSSDASAAGPDLPARDASKPDAQTFLTDLLSSPARLVLGESTTPAGARIFSSEPWDLSGFTAVDFDLRGKLDRLHSVIAEAEDIDLDLRLKNGSLNVAAKIAHLNGGRANVSGKFDAAAVMPEAALDLEFTGVYREPEKTSYPHDGHWVLSGSGRSEAELAGSLTGLGYMEFGAGPIDYRGLALLSADAATTMFRVLIPTAVTRQPEMRCGVTLADFNNGKGFTPYGWAARTRVANLLGSMEVDLKTERMKLRFKSQSREGVGISLGNAFSNSVDISGPLSDPRIVPNAPGLLIRGWAAFLTSGLSILGESVLNRVLASGNPCDDIRREIRKDLCHNATLLSSSPVACPLTAGASGPASANPPTENPAASPSSPAPATPSPTT